jgi:hypothetical protein
VGFFPRDGLSFFQMAEFAKSYICSTQKTNDHYQRRANNYYQLRSGATGTGDNRSSSRMGVGGREWVAARANRRVVAGLVEPLDK